MPHQCTNCDRTFADGSKEMLSGCPECGGTKFQFRPDGFDGESGSTGESAGADATAAAESASAAESPPEPTDRPGDSVSRTVGNAAATVRDLVSGSAGSDATQARPPADSPQATASGSESASPTESGAASATGAADPSDSSESSDSSFDDDIIVAESEPIEGEDAAQADARSQLVEPDEIPDSEGFDPAEREGPDVEPAADAAETAEGDTETPPSAAGSAADPAPDRTVADEPDAERADRPDLAELREELNEQFESIRVVEPGQYELNLMELYDREEYIIALQEDGRYSIQVPETWRQADA